MPQSVHNPLPTMWKASNTVVILAESHPSCLTLDLQLSFYLLLCYYSRAQCPLLQCLRTTSAIVAGAHSYFVVSSFKSEGRNNKGVWIFLNGRIVGKKAVEWVRGLGYISWERRPVPVHLTGEFTSAEQAVILSSRYVMLCYINKLLNKSSPQPRHPSLSFIYINYVFMMLLHKFMKYMF